MLNVGCGASLIVAPLLRLQRLKKLDPEQGFGVPRVLEGANRPDSRHSLLHGEASLLPRPDSAAQGKHLPEAELAQDRHRLVRAIAAVAHDDHGLGLEFLYLARARGELAHREMPRIQHVALFVLRALPDVEHKRVLLIDQQSRLKGRDRRTAHGAAQDGPDQHAPARYGESHENVVIGDELQDVGLAHVRIWAGARTGLRAWWR